MTSLADVLGGRYRLDQLLGLGGMSDVYRATDLTNGSCVALKLVRSNDPEFARRLTREARVLEGLDDPGLVHLLDTGLADGQAFLVMELVEGDTLSRALERGPFGAPASAQLGARLATALAHVHERGIVHRDVKPSNILLDQFGQAKLGDFGIAAHDDTTAYTQTGTTVGTVSYMAPEQLENHHVDVAADIWSLGIVLLECLTGQRAYQGSPSEVVARRVAGPVNLPPDLPAPWRQVLAGMLERTPERRLTAPQVAALLETSAFAAPWRPELDDLTTRRAVVDSSERTSAMPGVVPAAFALGDETRVVRDPRLGPARARSRHRGLIGALVVVALVVIGALIAGALRSSPDSTTTSPSTTTSTLGASAGSVALAILKNDVAFAQSAGNLDAASAQSILQGADGALSAMAANNTALATHDLQSSVDAVSSALTNGLVTSGTGALVQSDLTQLANAVGLSLVVSVTTSTTTTVPPPPPPGHGHGKGKH